MFLAVSVETLSNLPVRRKVSPVTEIGLLTSREVSALAFSLPGTMVAQRFGLMEIVPIGNHVAQIWGVISIEPKGSQVIYASVGFTVILPTGVHEMNAVGLMIAPIGYTPAFHPNPMPTMSAMVISTV